MSMPPSVHPSLETSGATGEGSAPGVPGLGGAGAGPIKSRRGAAAAQCGDPGLRARSDRRVSVSSGPVYLPLPGRVSSGPPLPRPHAALRARVSACRVRRVPGTGSRGRVFLGN